MSTDLIIAMICLTLFGGYVFTSLLLLRFPTLIHEKKKTRFKCRHISHRGGAGENLENTMAAFKHAKDSGTDMLEIDCHLTDDGQVVVSHDNDLQRVSGLQVLISQTKYNQLPQLKQSLGVDFSTKHITDGGDDRKIPLLRELFEHFPGMPINIDLKMDDDELIAKVSDLIKMYNREDITVWGNRSSTVIDKCHRVNPDILLFFSLKKVLYSMLMFYTGILPFVPIKESFFEVPMISIMQQFQNQFGWKVRVLVKICDFLLMSKVMFRHLERRGIQVYLWVLNDEEDFDRAFKHCCTGVMTDFPTKLHNFLKAHPEYGNKPV